MGHPHTANLLEKYKLEIIATKTGVINAKLSKTIYVATKPFCEEKREQKTKISS